MARKAARPAEKAVQVAGRAVVARVEAVVAAAALHQEQVEADGLVVDPRPEGG